MSRNQPGSRLGNKVLVWGNRRMWVSLEHTWLMQGIDWSGTSWQEMWGEDAVSGVAWDWAREEGDSSLIFLGFLLGGNFILSATRSHWKIVNRGVTLFDTFLKDHSVLKINIHLPSNSTPRYSPKTNENVCSQKDSCKNIHSSFIHNSKSWNSPHVHQ